jgi:hypothetical protein
MSEVGLVPGDVQGRVFSFAGTSAETKVSTDLNISAVHVLARRPR